MKMLAKINQSGRSMIEMLGVLAIIGVLSVGGIQGYTKAMAKYKLTKVQDQIMMIVMNVRAAYATQPSYGGLSNLTSIQYNITPNEMVVKGTTNDSESLFSAFGGQVAIRSGPHSDTHFSIKLWELGKEACRLLATSDWGADGLVSMDLNGIEYNLGSLPLSLGVAASGCNHESNYIMWEFY